MCAICTYAQETRGLSFPRGEKIVVGQAYPDITVKDINQNDISISSFAGKLVLVQFWASWCKPSRVDNSTLVNIYSQYKDRNFDGGNGLEIYSISLDDNSNNWRKAITEDNVARWYQVSELTGVNSDAARLYNVTAIPANFLINGDGIIIAKQFKISELSDILNQSLQQ